MSAVAIVIQTLLSADPVTANVGNRIEPTSTTQDTDLPSIVVTHAGELDPPILSGPGLFREATIIVNVRAPSYAQADAIMAHCIDALTAVIHDTVGAWSATIIRGEFSIADLGDDGRHHRRRQSFRVHWR